MSVEEESLGNENQKNGRRKNGDWRSGDERFYSETDPQHHAMRLQVLTPDGSFYEGEAAMVEFTTSEGEIGVYPGHIPLTALIAPGELRIHTDKEERRAFLTGGFAAVWPDRICLMAEEGTWAGEAAHRTRE